MFDKSVRFPEPDMNIPVGMFAGYKAAIVWTEQGSSCEHDLRKVLELFPNTQAILGVGVAGGMDRKKVSFCDVLVASQIIDYGARPRVQEGQIVRRGQILDTKQTLMGIFKGRTQWNFSCTTKDRKSKAVIGPIASGPFLLDDPDMKEGIKKEGAIGVEMEGWVLYTHILKEFSRLQVIIVKAVSDYADGKKDKKWQLTAAMAAASYVRCQLEDNPGAFKGKNTAFLTVCVCLLHMCVYLHYHGVM